jgi:hypothetical protein
MADMTCTTKLFSPKQHPHVLWSALVFDFSFCRVVTVDSLLLPVNGLAAGHSLMMKNCAI